MAWRQRVVVVGAGFGGIAVARALRKEHFDVLLIDRNNHHVFQPLLYQVATCALSPSEIAFPVRSIFASQKNVEVLFSEVQSINLKGRRIETSTGPIDYHFLVLAAGARNNHFGHDEWVDIAVGLKSLDDALEIRRRVLVALEIAEQETADLRRRELLTFCVIGGGPTGVEMSRTLVGRDFRHIRPEEITVMLLEGGPSILSTFSEVSRTRAVRQLQRLGVEVQTGARVTAIDQNSVTIQRADGAPHVIPAANVIWGAGVRASALTATLGVPLDRGGRIIVDRSLNVPGYDEVFAIGDCAACTNPDGAPVPGVAPAASQAGRFVAEQIVRRIRGLPTAQFRYVNKGNLATIGRSAAVAELGRAKLSGFIAWVLWLAVHICFLIGFRNRYIVLFQWVWHYFTNQGGARLITGTQRPRSGWPSQPRRLAKTLSSRTPALDS
jgi:NADH:ubiquinone reductase (H+-translocating)